MTAKFWVGGTGTWDNSTTTHWALSTGGAGGAAVPGTGDTVTFDGSSGGGTVTVAATINGSNAVTSIAMGAFTGTLDLSVNNPSITLSGSAAFSISGTGSARSLLLGTSTITITNSTANSTIWDATTTTNIGTTSLGSSTIIVGAPSAGNGPATFQGGGLSYGTLQITGKSNSTGFSMRGANNTFANIVLGAPLNINFLFGATTTITNAFTWAGSSGNAILVRSSSEGFATTISAASGSTLSWAALEDITFTTNAVAATNSFNLGGNTMNGGSITAPSGGGGGGAVIGS